VEAGGRDDAPEIAMPVAFPQLFKTKYDWDFASEPEQGLARRRIYLPRGRTLGGSSAMNAMIYIRGNKADFDGWASGGAAGWSYREMLSLTALLHRCVPSSRGGEKRIAAARLAALMFGDRWTGIEQLSVESSKGP
jgi:choline dehydrogenase-like flavoprotein